MTAEKYPRYRLACGWNKLVANAQNAQKLASDTTTDLLVVGAGYTGVAAARRWRELAPAERIVIVDSSTVGEGNPGRNSGFLLEIALAQDADPGSMQRMLACNRLLQATMQQLESLVAKHAIDCDLARTGTYRAAAGETGARALGQYAQFLEAAELPVERLDCDALAQRIGSRFYREGLYSPHCYLVQPARLIRGLVGSLDNVEIYEQTPALRLRQRQDHWEVQTPQATIRARKLVVANNAFCKGLGIGGARIAAMYTYAALTGVLTAEQLELCGTDSQWGLLPAHRLGSTLRRTRDGRLLIRSLYGYEREAGNAAVAGKLSLALQRRYPALGTLSFEYCWAGATGFTYNSAPLWGEFGRGLYLSAGCNGGGVVKGSLFGAQLAELAHGGSSADIAALFGRASWMPPEPLRRLGFELVAGVERRRARDEV